MRADKLTRIFTACTLRDARTLMFLGAVGITFFLILLALGQLASGDEGDELWSETYGGARTDRGRIVQETSDGGFIITGDTNTDSAGQRDVWLVKTDANGTEQWNKRYGGTGDDLGFWVRETTDNGFIITGYTNSSDGNKATRELWLFKTDADGNLLWEKTYGGSGDDEQDEGRAVAECSDKGFLVVGATKTYGAGNYDLWLLRTDSQGNEIWNRTHGGTNRDEGHSIQTTSDGGFIVSGRTEPSGSDNLDFWLMKLNADGDHIWDESWGGPKFDEAKDAIETSDGGFITTGRTVSYTSDGEPPADMWIIKTDKDGKKEWDKVYGGSELDFGRSILESPEGGYLICGLTKSYGSGDFDLWLVKTDENGDKTADWTFGGAQRDEGRCVVILDDGSYLLVGETESSGNGERDFWLIKAEGLQPNTLPELSIDSPEDHSVVEGLVAISGTASDDDGDETLQSVQFSLDDGAWEEVTGTESWSHDWDSTGVPNGEHSLKFRAFDGEDNSETLELTLNVENNHRPNLSIDSPANHSSVKGLVSISGTASDEDGDGTLQSVEFSLDDGAWEAVTGTDSWSHDWDSTAAADGDHQLSFRSFDGELYSEELTITLKLDNSPNQAPTITIYKPLNLSTVEGLVELKGTAGDFEETLEFIEVSVNGSAWFTVTGTELWEHEWNTSLLTPGSYDIQARAYDGSKYSNIINITVTVKEVTVDETPDPEKGEDEEAGFLPGFGLVGVLVLLVLVAFSRRRRA